MSSVEGEFSYGTLVRTTNHNKLAIVYTKPNLQHLEVLHLRNSSTVLVPVSKLELLTPEMIERDEFANSAYSDLLLERYLRMMENREDKWAVIEPEDVREDYMDEVRKYMTSESEVVEVSP